MLTVTIEEVVWDYWYDPDSAMWIGHSVKIGQVAEGATKPELKANIDRLMIELMDHLDEAGVDMAEWFRSNGLRVTVKTYLPAHVQAALAGVNPEVEAPPPPQLPIRMVEKRRPFGGGIEAHAK